MSVHRYNPRRDTCEKGIVWTLRYAGCIVTPISGEGVADLVVSCPWTEGVNYLLECKDEKTGELTPSQKKWHAAWIGQVAIVSTPLQALDEIDASGLVIATAMTAYHNEMLKPISKRFK